MGSGEVSFLPVPVKIDDSFVQIALQAGGPKNAFALPPPALPMVASSGVKAAAGSLTGSPLAWLLKLIPLGMSAIA